MQDVVNQITANPLFTLVLALLALLLIFLVLKNLFRMALFLVGVFVIYLVYVYFFPQVDSETIEEWTNKAFEFFDDFLSLVDSNSTRSVPKD
jgi:uncharacterized membrane protein YgaE (UPF0421/DUF939 family)